MDKSMSSRMDSTSVYSTPKGTYPDFEEVQTTVEEVHSVSEQPNLTSRILSVNLKYHPLPYSSYTSEIAHLEYFQKKDHVGITIPAPPFNILLS